MDFLLLKLKKKLSKIFTIGDSEGSRKLSTEGKCSSKEFTSPTLSTERQTPVKTLPSLVLRTSLVTKITFTEDWAHDLIWRSEWYLRDILALRLFVH